MRNNKTKQTSPNEDLRLKCLILEQNRDPERVCVFSNLEIHIGSSSPSFHFQVPQTSAGGEHSIVTLPASSRRQKDCSAQPARQWRLFIL